MTTIKSFQMLVSNAELTRKLAAMEKEIVAFRGRTGRSEEPTELGSATHIYLHYI